MLANLSMQDIENCDFIHHSTVGSLVDQSRKLKCQHDFTDETTSNANFMLGTLRTGKCSIALRLLVDYTDFIDS